MTWIYGLIWGAVAIFGATAVAALTWAIKSGQMQGSTQGARSIFDADEPVGKATDAPAQSKNQGG